MRRREFIAGLGSAAVSPLAVRAQRSMPVVGYLDPGRPNARPHLVAAFRSGLGEMGFVEGRNVEIEFRWANDLSDRLPELAADLVVRQVNAIAVAADGTTALAAKRSTSTIPIVFGMAGDPVITGLVASLNHPGGNVTGVTNIALELTAKRLSLLNNVLPRSMRFGALTTDFAYPNFNATLLAELQLAASAIGKQAEVLTVNSGPDIEKIFEGLPQKGIDGLLLSQSPLFAARRVEIVALAARHRIPVIYYDRLYSEAGGLMSYGSSVTEQVRLVGLYVGRILKGDKPADLPVIQPTKLELVFNLKTAQTLGLAIPETLLATADEVIQ